MQGQDNKFEKKFTINKGSSFTLMVQPNGLLGFTMDNGGVRPDICNQSFTTIKAAEKSFNAYLESRKVHAINIETSEKKKIKKAPDTKG